jgi:hypothetical protein
MIKKVNNKDFKIKDIVILTENEATELRLLPLFDRARNSLFILGNLMIQNATEV